MKTVTYRIARELEELGYDGVYYEYVDSDDCTCPRDSEALDDHMLPAPRLDDVAYWLRKRFWLLVTVWPLSRHSYAAEVRYRGQRIDLGELRPTFEGALRSAVELGLGMVKVDGTQYTFDEP